MGLGQIKKDMGSSGETDEPIFVLCDTVVILACRPDLRQGDGVPDWSRVNRESH